MYAAVFALAALLSGAFGACAQQGHEPAGNAKMAPQPPPAPPATGSHANAPAGKLSLTSRDVCVKHPNLKQCS